MDKAKEKAVSLEIKMFSRHRRGRRATLRPDMVVFGQLIPIPGVLSLRDRLPRRAAFFIVAARL